jgi:hypothetical protein
MAVTPDRRLWAAVVAGLAMIDIGHQPRSTAKPITYAGEISVDGHKQASGRELILPPGLHRVELDFDCIELTSPDRTRLQYHLDAGDQGWLDASPIHAAVYLRVPLGRQSASFAQAWSHSGFW